MKFSRSRINLDNINKLRLVVDDMGHIESTEADWSVERDPPKTSRLFYVIGGDPYIENNGNILKLEPGKCYLIPSGYSFKACTETSLDMIFFHLRLVDYGGIDTLKRCAAILSYTPAPELINSIKKHIRNDSFYSSLTLRCDLLGSILGIFEENAFELESSTHTYSPEVLKAIEYINSRLSIQLDVDKIAAEALVSVSTLTKKFKQEVGTTVSAYIDSAIMSESAYLLRNSNLTIQQISARFEFCYQSYFTRRFKQCYGITPQQFRSNR